MATGTPSTSNIEPSEVTQLKLQLQAARNEIAKFKKIIEATQNQKIYIPPDSEEEEKIVNQETAWLLPKNKKRKVAFSPEQRKVNATSNTNNSIKVHKPPPVVVSNVQNYQEIKQKLQAKNLNYNATLLNNNQVKINVNSATDYRELTKEMTDSKQQWHSYENKQERPIRVMVRNLHPSCDPKEILTELKEKGFKAISVDNKLKKIKENGKDKFIKLPLFMIAFDKADDIKKIFQIQYLANMKVKIETLRANNLAPQCKRCQRYGHTQKFCQRDPVCVKCAGTHLTEECTKPRNAPAKCSNCAEAHPANYRGCVIAKEIQKRRQHQMQKKSQPNMFSSKKATSVPYSEAVKSYNMQQVNTELPSESSEQVSMQQMIKQMMDTLNQFASRLDRLEARATGAIPKRY